MVYGASTKGITILQFFKLDNKLIKYAAERTPQKVGQIYCWNWNKNNIQRKRQENET